jgi:hypothetical protein
MIENVKTVSNPLTIIAIFAGLAEIAGTVALATVDKSIQSIFVWFVMAFPVLLVLLFFATLNLNAKILYAPSDFRDEVNFMNTVLGTRGVSESLEQIRIQLEEVTGRIVDQVTANVAAGGNEERQRIRNAVSAEVAAIDSRLQQVYVQANNVISSASGIVAPGVVHSNGIRLSSRILGYLSIKDAATAENIAQELKVSLADVVETLNFLKEWDWVTTRGVEPDVTYHRHHARWRE